jgi:multisubunit Na+/H+ antiporter MnhB subunit
MRLRSVIFETTVRLVFDAAIVLSIYFLFAGHNQPGGGFVGGLIAAAALALRYVAGGLDETLAVARARPWSFLSAGVLIAAGTALWPLLGGRALLDQRAFSWTIPLLGDVKLTTATIFDTGVYLIVVGLVLTILESLGDESDLAVASDDDEAQP